uniref:Uncharacterized protein n=1 Tax=Myoviridae sp. ctCo31 TaxID=2825053 RepID=A0A8S5UM16_9CAUD|nr:MAG TPA: hypothetical protein [Myoviridae sp. ctCo31]
MAKEGYLDWITYENMAPYETGFIVASYKRDMEERKKNESRRKSS